LQIEHLLLTIVLALALARVLGEIFRRLKQPSLVGELLAGVILGPSLLAFLSPDESMNILANIAVFFLIFMAGLELNLQEIRKSTRPAILLAVIGFTIPFIAGYQTSVFFGLGQVQSLFVGLLLSITAIPVSSIILMEFGILKSKIGTTVITAALINDIMAMIVFSMILIYPAEGQTFNFSEIGTMSVKIASFFAVLAIGVFVMKKMKLTSSKIEPFVQRLRTNEASVGILLSIGVAVALFAHYSNLHFIIGAFFAGLIFGSKFWGEKIHIHNSKLISGITFGFFAPIFFVFIGIEFDLRSITNQLPLLSALLAVAIVSKIVGGFIAAKLTRFSNNESLAIGCLMNGRGMVEMAIASIGYSMGLIDTSLFSVVIAIGFLTTIITPIITKPLIHRTVPKKSLTKKEEPKRNNQADNLQSSQKIMLEHRLKEIEQEKILLNYLRQY
jgi:Kef-type K+ transport system membrane component KefB